MSEMVASRNYIIIITCLLCFIIYLLAGNHNNEPKYVRTSTATLSNSKSFHNDDYKSPYQQKKEEVSSKADRAMSNMESSAQEEFSISKNWLHQAVEQAKISVHRTMDNYLKKEGALSDEAIRNIDEEISKRVEEELQAALVKKVTKAISEAKNNLNNVVDEDIDVTKDTKTIEGDIDTVRDFYVEALKDSIDDLELELESKIRGVTQKLEQKMIEDKLGKSISEEKLDEQEISSVVLEKEDEVFDLANKEAIALTQDIDSAEKKLEVKIKEVLQEYLTKEKRFSNTEAKEVEDKVFKELKDVGDSLLKDEINQLENIANENLDRIEETSDENIDVLHSAKNLGLQSRQKHDVDVVEKSLNELSYNLEDTFKQIAADSKYMIIDSLRKAMKPIEQQIFEEKGIKISEEDFVKLVDKETEVVEDKAN